MSPTETARPDGAWLDEGEVSPEWAAPAGDPSADPGSAGAWSTAACCSSLVLVIGLLYSGGFEKRTDLLGRSQPGTLIITGPYEFRFTEATAQPKTDTDGKISAGRSS